MCWVKESLSICFVYSCDFSSQEDEKEFSTLWHTFGKSVGCVSLCLWRIEAGSCDGDRCSFGKAEKQSSEYVSCKWEWDSMPNRCACVVKLYRWTMCLLCQSETCQFFCQFPSVVVSRETSHTLRVKISGSVVIVSWCIVRFRVAVFQHFWKEQRHHRVIIVFPCV